MARLARIIRRVVLSVALLAVAGCQQPINPSFSLTQDQARRLLDDMAAHPVPQARPLLVLGGWRDLVGVDTRLRDKLAKYFVHPTIIAVGFTTEADFPECRAKALEQLRLGLGLDDTGKTPLPQVDVVAYSMGGLIARDAAAPRFSGDALTLPIARLFTISTPHRGADLAELPNPDSLAEAMKPGSEFLQQLRKREGERRYPIFAYVRLDDAVVGAERAAPITPGDAPGPPAWWVPNPPLELAHLDAWHDPRILADIIRRLRGEPPLTKSPPAPLP